MHDKLVYIIDLMTYLAFYDAHFGREPGPAGETCPMNTDSVRDDLAFMRALVSSGEGSPAIFGKTFGELYSAGGLCYGVQMLLHGGQFLGWLPTSSGAAMLIGFGPTVVFLAALVWILSRADALPPTAVNRAVGAVFGAVGMVNLLMIAIIGSVAWRLHNLTVWLIYPCLVMVMQGVAWRVAFAMRRRPWMMAVALGWFVTGIGMAAAILNIGAYITVAGLGLIGFMLIPGLAILRQARQASA